MVLLPPQPLDESLSSGRLLLGLTGFGLLEFYFQFPHLLLVFHFPDAHFLLDL